MRARRLLEGNIDKRRSMALDGMVAPDIMAAGARAGEKEEQEVRLLEAAGADKRAERATGADVWSKKARKAGDGVWGRGREGVLRPSDSALRRAAAAVERRRAARLKHMASGKKGRVVEPAA